MDKKDPISAFHLRVVDQHRQKIADVCKAVSQEGRCGAALVLDLRDPVSQVIVNYLGRPSFDEQKIEVEADGKMVPFAVFGVDQAVVLDVFRRFGPGRDRKLEARLDAAPPKGTGFVLLGAHGSASLTDVIYETEERTSTDNSSDMDHSEEQPQGLVQVTCDFQEGEYNVYVKVNGCFQLLCRIPFEQGEIVGLIDLLRNLFTIVDRAVEGSDVNWIQVRDRCIADVGACPARPKLQRFRF